MKIVRILIVLILSLCTISHAVTDYEQCGESKICWIDRKCSKPSAPSSMIKADQYSFTTEEEQNCPRFFTIRPCNLKKWEVEMMDNNTTMQAGVGLKRGKDGDVFMCKDDRIQSGVTGIVISDESFINDTSGGVHCIFNVSVENDLLSTKLNSFGSSSQYHFGNSAGFDFSYNAITTITPCSEDFDCANDEVCSPRKINATDKEVTCSSGYEKLYNDGDGNWKAVDDSVTCEDGSYQINSTSRSQNAQLKCARKKCRLCTSPGSITKGSFIASSDSEGCAHIKCSTSKMLINNSTLYNGNRLNCSSSHLSLWKFGRTPMKISTVQCIDKVPCTLLTPIYSNCTGREFCSKVNLTNTNPSCDEGEITYVDSASQQVTPLSSINCDETTGKWALMDKDENDVTIGSSILLQCISSQDDTAKSEAKADGPPYTVIICAAVGILLIFIILVVVIVYLCKCRKAKAAGGTASVKSEAKDVNDKPESVHSKTSSKTDIPIDGHIDKTAPAASQADSTEAKNQDIGTSAPDTPASAAQEKTAESKDDVINGTTVDKPAPAATPGKTPNPEPSDLKTETTPDKPAPAATLVEEDILILKTARSTSSSSGKKNTASKTGNASGKKKSAVKSKKKVAKSSKKNEDSVEPPPQQKKPQLNRQSTNHNQDDKKGKAYIEEYPRSHVAPEPSGDEEANEVTALSDEEDSPNRRTCLDIAAIYAEFHRIVATEKAEIKFLTNEVEYTASQVVYICTAVINPLIDGGCQPKVPLPCVVAGDMHGQYHDLVTIFKTMARDEKPGHLCRRYIFMGDYVDRGPHSLEVLMMLFILKTRFPANFTLLRGNHESCSINETYGFANELKLRFPNENDLKEVRHAIYKAFSYLPFTAIAGDCFYLAHGGIGPNLFNRDDAAIPLPLHCCKVKGNAAAMEIMWSDPDSPTVFYKRNDARNDGVCYGEQAVEDFRRKFRVNKVFRGHQVVSGVLEWFNDRVITVFSASGFEKGDSRAGAIVYLAKSKEHDKVYKYYGPRLSNEVMEKLRDRDGLCDSNNNDKKENNKNKDDEVTVATD